MRLFRLAFVLLAAVYSVLATAATPIDPRDVLVLEGEGYELGHKHGEALKQDILTLQRQWLMPKLNRIPFLVEFYAKQKTKNMKPHIPQRFVDEMRGVADAVGMDYETNLIVNAVPDVMELLKKPFGCSTFVSLPWRSASKGMLYGRNLDYGESDVLRPYWHATVFAVPGKNRILSINVPGMSGVLTAINDKGVMMSRMTSYSRDIRSHGVPSMLLFRQILEEADSAAEAVEMYQTAARTVAINVMITDAKQAFVLEATANHTAVRVPNDSGVLYSANHFETPAMNDGRHDRDGRWPALARLDSTRDVISADDVLETMARAETPGENILAVVVDYGKGTLVFGSDPEGNGTAARGALREIQLRDWLPGFPELFQ